MHSFFEVLTFSSVNWVFSFGDFALLSNGVYGDVLFWLSSLEPAQLHGVPGAFAYIPNFSTDRSECDDHLIISTSARLFCKMSVVTSDI